MKPVHRPQQPGVGRPLPNESGVTVRTQINYSSANVRYAMHYRLNPDMAGCRRCARLGHPVLQHFPSLLDHLIGSTEQRQRDREAERLGRLQVDNKFDLRRLFYW
jgi:hypothetical protein